jgi:creatinine amidohydrolase/Fe(II)-dependent formamide hydrolase-like protein
MRRLRLLIAVAVVSVPASADAQSRERRTFEEQYREPRPIEALSSVWIEALTWMEVRDLLAEGTRTVIVPTGGIEQNGPYVATGKHNYIMQAACEAIARALGDALCAPVIKLVPEGDLEEPSGHMRYPGTFSLRPSTFEAVLDDVGTSMRAHGFEHIVYIGDSGSNQEGMRNVASRLNERWGRTVAHYIPEFYDIAGIERLMRDELDVHPESEGYHDFYWITAMLAAVDPETVRFEQRVAAGRASIDGISLEPIERTIEHGRRLLQYRVDSTVPAIRAAIDRSGG